MVCRMQNPSQAILKFAFWREWLQIFLAAAPHMCASTSPLPSLPGSTSRKHAARFWCASTVHAGDKCQWQVAAAVKHASGTLHVRLAPHGSWSRQSCRHELCSANFHSIRQIFVHCPDSATSSTDGKQCCSSARAMSCALHEVLSFETKLRAMQLT